MGCVYLARCKVNNKGYVGKTVKSLSKRKEIHQWDAYNGSPCIFHKAIRKYGWDAFEWSILSEDDDEDWLFLMEQKWIKRLGTKLPNGYNMTDGGDGTPGCSRSKSAIEKTAAAHRGRKNTEETKLKMSIAAKNRAPVTDETKKILSESHMGVKRSLESRIKQSISAKGKPKPPRTAEHKAKISATLKLYNAKKREMK